MKIANKIIEKILNEGTAAFIGLEKKDGQIDYIYCNYDGYPDGVGTILEKYYKDEKKIRDLINLGSLSSLAKNVSPEAGQEHSWKNPAKDVTVAYKRDRKENGRKSPMDYETVRSREYYLAEAGNVSYCYLYSPKEGQWLISDNQSRKFEPLKDII